MAAIAYPVIILIGYLLGSLPSAYLIGRIWAKVDLRQEGDGHISAMATYRYLGWKALALVMAMDMGKGVLAIYIASTITDSQTALISVAYAAVLGHCWSIYLRFRGGIGGSITFAVLSSLALKETFIGVGVFLIILLFTRKTSWGTYVLLGTASIALWIEHSSWIMVIYPWGLLAIHLLKRYQTRRANPVSSYSNEALADLRKYKNR